MLKAVEPRMAERFREPASSDSATRRRPARGALDRDRSSALRRSTSRRDRGCRPAARAWRGWCRSPDRAGRRQETPRTPSRLRRAAPGWRGRRPTRLWALACAGFSDEHPAGLGQRQVGAALQEEQRGAVVVRRLAARRRCRRPATTGRIRSTSPSVRQDRRELLEGRDVARDPPGASRAECATASS